MDIPHESRPFSRRLLVTEIAAAGWLIPRGVLRAAPALALATAVALAGMSDARAQPASGHRTTQSGQAIGVSGVRGLIVRFRSTGRADAPVGRRQMDGTPAGERADVGVRDEFGPALARTRRRALAQSGASGAGDEAAATGTAGTADADGSGTQTGLPSVSIRRALTDDSVVLGFDRTVSLAEAKALARRLADDEGVAYVVPDVPVQPSQVSGASVFGPLQMTSQWSLAPSTGSSGSAGTATDGSGSASFIGTTANGVLSSVVGSLSNVGGAGFSSVWGMTQGAAVTVAVVDTGITAHPDLAGQGHGGYDFISPDADGTFYTANDGDGRDGDPTDTGNYCDRSSPLVPSSWHGTEVAGVLAARVTGGSGLWGAAPAVNVQSLRVMGRCGGRSSDVVDAIRWAAGLPVPGVPANPSPARVINLSLSTAWNYRCDAAMQDAVDAAIGAGAVIVAAAGNEAQSAGYPAQGGVSAPANCLGVIAVSAHTRSGDRSVYANHGPAVTLTAPGGGACAMQSVTCRSDSIVTAGNAGQTGPGAAIVQPGFNGTSAATPHVAAAAAMLLSVRPELTPRQVAGLLTSGARPWPADSWCAQPQGYGQCGAGMLNIQESLARVDWPLVSIEPVRGAQAGRFTVRLAASVQARDYAPSQMRFAWYVGSANSLGTPTAADGATAAAAAAAAGETGVTIKAASPVSMTGTGTSRVVATLVGSSAATDQLVIDNATTATPLLTLPSRRAEIPLSVQVTDPLGRVAWATTMVQVDNPPQVEPVDPMFVTMGQPIDARLSATDPDGDTVRYTLLSGPPGLKIGRDDGRIQWTPDQPGQHEIRFEASDDYGAASTPITAVVRVGLPGEQPVSMVAGGGSGGGGAVGWGTLLLFMTLVLLGAVDVAVRRRRTAGVTPEVTQAVTTERASR